MTASRFPVDCCRTKTYGLVVVLALACVLSPVDSSAQETAAENRSASEKSVNVTSADVIRKINDRIQSKWRDASIEPNPACTDSQFVRRVYLDLCGRIPTVQERQTFLSDERADKRRHLVDLLLTAEDYVQHFTDVFDTLLMDRGNEQRYRDRSNNQWRAWLERVFRENRPWKDAVSEILLARPESNSDRGVVWFLYERKDDHQKIAESVARAFFGIRIDCAQCHDHMIASEIEQRHYWGLVAFFNRSQNVKTKNGPRVEESAIGGFSDFANLEGSSSPNLLTFFQSPTVDEQRPADGEKQVDADDLYMPPPREHEPRIPRFSRRQQLVDHIVADHPLLAPAFVNRVWAMLMGRGIVHPFDQMDSAHPPSHPELLADLASAFEDSGEDIRELVKAIVLSRPYQLTSVRPDGINDPSTFAWTLEKPLTAEQLSRSIQVAVQGSFRNDHPLTVKLRDALPDVMPEQSVTSIGDALFLTNNAAINDLIASSREPTHLVPTLLNITDLDQRADDLFTTVFGRLPTADERVRVAEFCQQDAEHRLPQVLWALLCSAEFRFNH